MKGIIRIGDITTSGRAVFTGSVVVKFASIPVAREGDPVLCSIPGHDRTVIAEGHPIFKNNGIPIAFDGQLCACGGALISSWSEARAS
ncbi:PAAR domain-containing protein [Pseudomonas fluorescens]|uniref:PAAR domain-containing protein n=1 Tax=Pseudomonas fluorescens TaxID=294 RepID=UPI00123F0CF9|nr:PAAR domain-containing protein [Pseudomonas fluorescens]